MIHSLVWQLISLAIKILLLKVVGQLPVPAPSPPSSTPSLIEPRGVSNIWLALGNLPDKVFAHD